MDNDLVFKALADPTRRRLLDLLFEKDGQTLIELTVCIPMSRFGVMKHLKILEESALIVHRKIGRSKFHYLNPIPIQQVYDRWVSKYAKPFASGLTSIKRRLEKIIMNKHKHVYEILIETSPEKLWQALTDPQMTKQYFYGTEVVSDWNVGGEIRYVGHDGNEMLYCEILEIDEPRRLVVTFKPLWEGATTATQPSRVTYEIEQLGKVCRLILTHDELDKDHPLNPDVRTGWAEILSGMKTLLETGNPMARAATS